MELTERIIKLNDPAGFDRLFEKERLNYETDKAAFQALNREYFEAFGEHRYKNWDSYRVTRFKRIS